MTTCVGVGFYVAFLMYPCLHVTLNAGGGYIFEGVQRIRSPQRVTLMKHRSDMESSGWRGAVSHGWSQVVSPRVHIPWQHP